MRVDAPVVNVEGPGACHSPVVDVLHRVKDFHLKITHLYLLQVLDGHKQNKFVFILDDNRDTYSQAILGGWDGVELSVIVEPSHGTHLKKEKT